MAVIKFLVYITCFCSSQVLCDDYGESGNEITLTPIIRGKPEEILWTHNGNKVLEYDRRNLMKYGSFKGRVEVDFETGQLTIRELNSQDSGKYDSEILINGKAQTSSHTLTVLDALPKPLVTCELDETSNLKKLSCSVESQTQPSYEWSGPDIKQPGPTLLVEQEEKQDSVYTCTVKNKAASRTTDFTLQDCHTGGVNPAVLVPVLIVLIILLAVLVLYLYKCKRQKSGESEREKNYPENGECDNLLINVPVETMPDSPADLEKEPTNISVSERVRQYENQFRPLETQDELKLQAVMNGPSHPGSPPTGGFRETENGECDNLLMNVPIETMPGSSDAALPCRTRLTAPKESIADKKWDQDSESENLSKTHEGKKLLKASPQTAITEKNKQDTGNTNEGELNKNEKNSEYADEAEENANSKPDETDRETESQKFSQTQGERETDKSQTLKNERENEEESPEEQIVTQGEQNKKEDADKNEDDKTPEEKKEKKEENEEMNSSNTGDNLLRKVPTEAMPGSSDATLPCHTRLTAPNESIKKWDQDSESENAGETREGPKLLKKSLQSAITGKNQEDKENRNKGELDKSEKNAKNADVAEENANSKPDETQSQKTEDADKNYKDQTTEEKKENEEENKETDSPDTAEPFNPPSHSEASSDPVDSPADLENEPTNISVLERVRQIEISSDHWKLKMNDRKYDPSTS